MFSNPYLFTPLYSSFFRITQPSVAFGSIGRADDNANNRYLLDDAKLKRTRIPTIAELPEFAPPPPPAAVEAPKETDVLRSMLAQAWTMGRDGSR